MTNAILIVDDNRVNRRAAMAVCGHSGVPCDEAASAEEALELLKSSPYAAVLLDLRMPGMSGEEMCQAVREDEALKALPVIAYTAHVQRADVELLLRRGFDAVLVKPVRVSEFERLLRSLGLLTS